MNKENEVTQIYDIEVTAPKGNNSEKQKVNITGGSRLISLKPNEIFIVHKMIVSGADENCTIRLTINHMIVAEMNMMFWNSNEILFRLLVLDGNKRNAIDLVSDIPITKDMRVSIKLLGHMATAAEITKEYAYSSVTKYRIDKVEQIKNAKVIYIQGKSFNVNSIETGSEFYKHLFIDFPGGLFGVCSLTFIEMGVMLFTSINGISFHSEIPFDEIIIVE